MVDYQVNVFKYGSEGLKVLVIDDFLPNFDDFFYNKIPDLDLFEACSEELYPGYRLYQDNFDKSLIAPIFESISENFNENSKGRLKSCAYSIATASNKDVAKVQLIPHFDSFSKSLYACVLYLSPNEYHVDDFGTSFFKHLKTNFEFVDRKRSNIYFHSLFDSNMPEHFIQGTNESFEELLKVSYKQNRLVIYPSNVLHSGMLPNVGGLPKCIERGRLTLNYLIDYSI